MSQHRRNGPQHSDAAAGGKAILKTLSAAIKLISLYQPNHPVAAKGMTEAWVLIKQRLAEGEGEFAVAFIDGRWIFAGTVLGEASHPTEALVDMFRALDLRTVVFQPGVRLFEVTAFCKLAALAASPADPVDPAGYFKRTGVKHIRLDLSAYSRVSASAAADAPPPAASAPGPIPAPASPRLAGQSFGVFIKGLVESSVDDPEARAQIYAETLSHIKTALARRVSEATESVRAETRVLTHELTRTEGVLTSGADGKVIVDRDGRVLMMDAVAEAISGKRLIDLAGKPLLDSAMGGEAVVSLAEDLSVSDDPDASREVRTSGTAEVMAAMRHSTAVVHNEQGRVVGIYSVLPSTTKYRETLRMQEEFVSHVTHELNAPLASICAALELFSQMAASKFTAQEAHFIEVSMRNSRLLKQMIAEILDFSKLSSGQMTVKPVSTSAASILSESADSLKPWAVSKGLTIDIAADPALERLMVLADHGRVVQVVTNLVSNAIKSTPAGGRISLAAVAAPGSGAVFSVKDTGCGISKDDQEKIFQRFAQGADGLRRREGVGLGLAIVKELVGMHGGKLWVESKPGHGAAFFFNLPLA